MKLIVATLLAAAAVSAAHAQTVFRCGNAYSQAPCPQARLVEASDARSTTQHAEARRVADDERRLAAEMRRERLDAERAARADGARAASLSGPAPTTVAAVPAEHPHTKKHRPGKASATTDFIAHEPGSRKRRTGR